MKIELMSFLLYPPSLAAAPQSALQETVRAQTKTLHLKRNRVLRMERKQQFKKIEVRSGVLWLTGSPAEGDVLLEPNQTFELRNGWPYVIEAIETAEILLTRA